jgi:3-deoxy-D-manno-octulosonic-acid transferase
MKSQLAMLIYRAVLPVLFLLFFPNWMLKMLRRGGFGSKLYERLGLYFEESEFEFAGAIHFHAISVGETMLALKLQKAWAQMAPEARFVIATGTATGHALASSAAIPNLRVTYSPLDFPWMVRSYLSRFEPKQIILIESDVWPNMIQIAAQRRIPISLANARCSPRSARRILRFASVLRPFYSKISCVCIQEKEHRTFWVTLGISPEHIHCTGSLKFDPASSRPPLPNPDFAEMLASFGKNRPLILAASTFPGEEEMLAEAIIAADAKALPVIVPRHAERRSEASAALQKIDFQVTLRSQFQSPPAEQKYAFLIDSTGELATWTAHANVVVIGKSFLSHGGQNPAEAILCRKPLILGPHMENFQPLAGDLLAAGGALLAHDSASLITAIREALDPIRANELSSNASRVLATHEGATQRHLSALHLSASSA